MPERRLVPAARPYGALVAALVAAATLLLAMPTFADAGTGGTGGIGTSSDPGKADGKGDLSLTPSKYERLWDRARPVQRRWARNTSECESGHDPNALGLGGEYRGAFQFTRDAWTTSPKTPGGDPIDYSWRTQAVVAVALKKRDGTRPWPVCG